MINDAKKKQKNYSNNQIVVVAHRWCATIM